MPRFMPHWTGEWITRLRYAGNDPGAAVAIDGRGVEAEERLHDVLAHDFRGRRIDGHPTGLHHDHALAVGRCPVQVVSGEYDGAMRALHDVAKKRGELLHVGDVERDQRL